MFKKLLAFFAAMTVAIAFAAVDVNKATPAELDGVKGIGPVISAKIIDERKKGNFKSWEDFIERVKGIGEGNAAKFSAEGLTVAGSGYKGAAATATPAAAKADTKPAAAAKVDAKPAATATAAPAKPEVKADAKPAAPAAVAAAPAMAKDEKKDPKADAKMKKEEEAKAKADAAKAKKDEAAKSKADAKPAAKDDKKVDAKAEAAKPAASAAKK